MNSQEGTTLDCYVRLNLIYMIDVYKIDFRQQKQWRHVLYRMLEVIS